MYKTSMLLLMSFIFFNFHTTADIQLAEDVLAKCSQQPEMSNPSAALTATENITLLTLLKKQVTSELGATADAGAYVQKLMVPNKSHICFMGDIHGSINSLLRNIKRIQKLGYLDKNLKIIDKKEAPFYMIFTGDYIDRGPSSVEVFYTLATLKLANFDRVYLLKGNHEDPSIYMRYGFYKELQEKYPQKLEQLNNLYNDLFNLLPLALYLGTTSQEGKKTFVQCCHGGIEPFYNPVSFLTKSPEVIFETIPKKVDYQHNNNLVDFGQGSSMAWQNGNGFLWGDFDSSEKISPKLVYSHGRSGTIASKQAVESYLNTINNQLKAHNTSLCGFFRGHQHNNFGLKLGGLEHWQEKVNQTDQQNKDGFSVEKYGPVFTFSTAAEGVELPYDCFCVLTVDAEYENWRLKPYEIPV